MKKSSHKRISAAAVSLATAICIMFACSAILAATWFYTKYLPLLLLSLIFVLPACINLLLLIPNGKTYTKPQKPEKPPREKLTLLKRISKIPGAIAALFKKTINFISRNRIKFMLALSALLLIAVNTAFWMFVRRGAEHKLTFVMPVSLAVIFVLFIVLDKWTKHISLADDSGRNGIIAQNLHSFITAGEIVLAASAVCALVCTLGFFDLQKWLVIFLAFVFVYENLFIVISLCVRVIRDELYTNPEVPLPLFGKSGNLSIIGYLEKNTGISMRSLWSIRLIKTLVPYTLALGAVVLWLSTGIVQIETYQQGALYRLGKLSEDSLEPGIHLTLPVPFDKVEVYDTQTVNELTVGYLATDATDNLWTEAHGNNEYKLLLGGGNELVSINLRIEYKISDLKDYLACSSSPVKILESCAYGTVTDHTINTDLDSLLAADRTAFSKSFEKTLRERISGYNTGLDIVGVVIESIHPPVEVAQIYQRIISAGIEAEKIILEAEGLAGTTIAEAQSDSDKSINAANADSHKKKAEAESAVAEFMASVQANKDYGDGYRYYKYLDALTAAYSGTKLIIVGDGIDTNSLYLGSLS